MCVYLHIEYGGYEEKRNKTHKNKIKIDKTGTAQKKIYTRKIVVAFPHKHTHTHTHTCSILYSCYRESWVFEWKENSQVVFQPWRCSYTFLPCNNNNSRLFFSFIQLQVSECMSLLKQGLQYVGATTRQKLISTLNSKSFAYRLIKNLHRIWKWKHNWI